MFTPPPSPGISPLNSPQDSVKLADAVPSTQPSEKQEQKRRIGRRTRWTVILVPLVLILITASTRYITHPVAFDVLADSRSLDWELLASKGADWSIHDRHQHLPRQQQNPPPTGTSSAPVVTTTAGTAQPLPTIPTDAPTLPTPFPQPFDSDTSKNFSSVTCYNFFANMTNTPAFRSCRPFSLLLQTSSDLINAQNNLTLLNAIMWGTCNTTLPEDQCVSNMNWFAAQLKDACAQDLKDQNDKATDTLTALQAYDVMRQAGCLADPTTNTYCYLSAVHNSNPADNYFYQLPLGVPLPNSGKPSCSACSKSIMGMYEQALGNASIAGTLMGLQKTYNDAAEKAISDCGQAYATLAASSAVPLVRVPTALIALSILLTGVVFS